MIDGQAPVEIFDEIDSTLLEARRRAEAGDTGPVWLIAKRQTAGKGRRGRSWVSIEGNLLATYLFATARPVSELPLLGFAAAVAIAETLEAAGADTLVTVKWPNDVLIGGAKASGILLDSGALAGGGTWAALGFGVNIAGAPAAIDQDTQSLAGVLRREVRAPSAIAFFNDLRPRLETWAARLVGEGFEPLRRAWLARAHGLEQVARVRQGDEVLEGRIVGLSSRGELELDTHAGRRLIAAGELILSNAA